MTTIYIFSNAIKMSLWLCVTLYKTWCKEDSCLPHSKCGGKSLRERNEAFHKPCSDAPPRPSEVIPSVMTLRAFRLIFSSGLETGEKMFKLALNLVSGELHLGIFIKLSWEWKQGGESRGMAHDDLWTPAHHSTGSWTQNLAGIALSVPWVSKARIRTPSI